MFGGEVARWRGGVAAAAAAANLCGLSQQPPLLMFQTITYK